MNKSASPLVIYAATSVLAACSLLYELLIAQTLATLAANTVVWYSVTIGVYLASMGLGALLHGKYAGSNLWLRLFRVELLLAAVGAVAVPVLYFTHTFALLIDLDEATLLSNIVFFGSAFTLIVTIGILTGFELPLLIDLGNEAAVAARVTNRVLASDYMGSLLGGLLFPLVLVPHFSLFVAGLLTAALNLVVAFMVLRWFLPASHRPKRRVAASGAIASALMLAMLFAGPIEGYFVKNYYFYDRHSDDLSTLFGSLENVDDVFRARSPYQRIDIVHDDSGFESDVVIDFYSSKFVENPAQPKNYLLFLNGDFQFTSSYEEFYHEYFAHVPIATNGATPRNVLVLGAGDGLLIRELIKYPDIERIVHVDLDHKLVELAETHPVLLAMNEGSLEDPRVHTDFDDAFRYIRNSTDNFDAIYLDFPFAVDYNLSKLYSREFFHFVRQRLAPGGFMIFNAPRIEYRSIVRDIYLNTVKAAGFEHIQPFVARFERVNQEALDYLVDSGGAYKESKFMLMRHSYTLQQGFVIGRNHSPQVPLFRDPRVKMHALNDERLRWTLKKRIYLPRSVEKEKVNSIFQPTLPVGDIWEIRSRW